jgi:DNA-binding NtrC family response regulator/signal transduction histidine kinase
VTAPRERPALDFGEESEVFSIERVGWLIRLRWLALLGIGIAAALAAAGAFPGVRYTVLIVTAAFAGVYNFLLWRSYRDGATPAGGWAATVQALGDIFLLTVVLWAAGGAECPFVSYYVFHVAIVGILAGPRATQIAAVTAIVGVGFLVLSSQFDPLRIGVWAPIDPWGVIAEAVAFVSTLGTVAYLVTHAVRELRDREKALIRARDNAALEYELLSNTLDQLEAGLEVLSEDGAVAWRNRRAEELRQRESPGPSTCPRSGHSCRSNAESCPIDLALAQREPGRCRFAVRAAGQERVYEMLTFPLATTRAGARLMNLYVDRTAATLADQRLLLAERLVSLGRVAQGVAHELNTPLATIRTLASDMRATLRAGQEEAHDGAHWKKLALDIDESAALVHDETLRLGRITQSLLAGGDLVRNKIQGGVPVAAVVERARAGVRRRARRPARGGGPGCRRAARDRRLGPHGASAGQPAAERLRRRARPALRVRGDPRRAQGRGRLHLHRGRRPRRLRRGAPAPLRALRHHQGARHRSGPVHFVHAGTRHGRRSLARPARGRRHGRDAPPAPRRARRAREQPGSKSMKGKVLIIDDDKAFRFALNKALRRHGFDVEEAESAESAMGRLSRPEGPDVALLDLRMAGMGGLELLRRRGASRTRFVVLTGHGTVQAAVEAMQLGAFSFLEKPVDAEVLAPLLMQAIADRKSARGEGGGDVPPLIGPSAEMEAVRRFVARAGPTDETVAIYGETGSGKEVVARHIHLASLRRGGPFVAFNCAAVARELFESELFGHRRGAFTGATEDHPGLFREAHGGTLFIDELAELPLDSQAKLLRALEARTIRPVGEKREVTVDARILAATNRDLWSEVQAGRFREDLYFRLQVLPVVLAPLRRRPDDIVPLAEHLLGRLSGAHQLTDEARQVLSGYRWPGNVRELLNVLRRATLFAEGALLDGELVRRMIAASVFAHGDLTLAPAAARADNGRGAPPPELRESQAPPAGASTNLAEVERSHIERVLSDMGGNITRAASALGIDRRTLQRKLKAYGIEAD